LHSGQLLLLLQPATSQHAPHAVLLVHDAGVAAQAFASLPRVHWYG
jgi:hypothetical protein